MDRVQRRAPLLKWPGGKRGLLQHLFRHIPREFGRYYEPFFGGGALFFALQPNKASLSDLNEDLIDCYITVRDNPGHVVRQLRKWRNSSRMYYSVRDLAPRSRVQRAARVVYLSTLAFNGIYRVNRRGVFNVPFGYKTHLDVAQADRIAGASKALKGKVLRHCDFEEAVASATADDLVYLDPPYTLAHGTNGFRKYNAELFSWDDQIRLAAMAKRLVKRGCHVIVSNADHACVRELYRGFRQTVIPRVSKVAASSRARRLVHELIITGRQ